MSDLRRKLPPALRRALGLKLWPWAAIQSIDFLGKNAITDGLHTAGLTTTLEDMEAQLATIDAKLAAPARSPVRLPPQSSGIYLQKVEGLSQTLANPEISRCIEGHSWTHQRCHGPRDRIQINLDGAIQHHLGA